MFYSFIELIHAWVSCEWCSYCNKRIWFEFTSLGGCHWRCIEARQKELDRKMFAAIREALTEHLEVEKQKVETLGKSDD